MLTKMKIALALTGSLLVGGVAMAKDFGGADHGQRKAEMLQKYDTNKNGTLDDSEKAALRADFKAKRQEMHAKRVAQFDTNKDGKLDQTERAAAKKERTAEMFKKLDLDGNGSITLSELEQAKMDGHHGHRGGHRGFKRGFGGDKAGE